MPQSARQLRKNPLQLARGAPQVRRPQKPACARELQEKQQQPAPAKKRPRSLSQCKSKSRPQHSPRCKPHPKPPSPSKLRQTAKASAHERRLLPFHRKLALHCTNLRQLTRLVLRRTFAPKGVSRHESRRHEETADDRDKRATRVRTRIPDSPPRVRTVRETGPRRRSRAGRLAPRGRRNHAEKSTHYR